MRILLILDCLDGPQHTGISRFAYNLTANILKYGSNDEYVLLHKKKNDLEMFNASEEIIVPDCYLLDSRSLQLSLVLRKYNFDIIYSPHYPLFLTKGKNIITLHDLRPLLYPQNSLHYMSTYSKHALFRVCLKYYNKICCISNNTKKDFIKYLRISEDKTVVIYGGVDPTFKVVHDQESLSQFTEKYGINYPFILYVGQITRIKNVPRLIKALQILLNQYNIKHKLVLIGSPVDINILDLIRKNNLQKNIILLSNIPDEDLVYFYNLADVFIFPSLYEGFGLPVLEAMACGCPVITSNTSSLPEVVGDVAIKVNPTSVDEIVDAILSLVEDIGMQKRMIEKGFEQVKKFSWERTAKQYIKVFCEM